MLGWREVELFFRKIHGKGIIAVGYYNYSPYVSCFIAKISNYRGPSETWVESGQFFEKQPVIFPKWSILDIDTLYV